MTTRPCYYQKIFGVELTFKQAADLFDMLASQPDSCCHKMTDSPVATELQGMSTEFLFAHQRNDGGDQTMTGDQHQAAYNFVTFAFRSMKQDLAETYNLCFGVTRHDVYENKDLAGVLGISPSQSRMYPDSHIRLLPNYTTDGVIRGLSKLLETDGEQLKTVLAKIGLNDFIFGLHMMADSCACCG